MFTIDIDRDSTEAQQRSHASESVEHDVVSGSFLKGRNSIDNAKADDASESTNYDQD